MSLVSIVSMRFAALKRILDYISNILGPICVVQIARVSVILISLSMVTREYGIM